MGREFLRAVAQVLQRVAEGPKGFPIVHRNTRRAHVTRFPYGVLYRIVEDEVVVVACFHARRDPRRWKERR